MVNIALHAQLELILIQRKSNAIIARKDSKETTTAMPAFQNFDQKIYRFIVYFIFSVFFEKLAC
jgi:hypothetical protein